MDSVSENLLASDETVESNFSKDRDDDLTETSSEIRCQQTHKDFLQINIVNKKLEAKKISSKIMKQPMNDNIQQEKNILIHAETKGANETENKNIEEPCLVAKYKVMKNILLDSPCQSSDQEYMKVIGSKDESLRIIKKLPESSTKDSARASVDEELITSVNKLFAGAINNLEIKVHQIPEEMTTKETCHQCCMVKKCLYKLDTTFICSEACLISLRTLNKSALESLKKKNLKDVKEAPGTNSCQLFVRKCTECAKPLKLSDNNVLSWEAMDYCNAYCLSIYQSNTGSHCINCTTAVDPSSLGKYCVRLGRVIQQFCSSACLEDFKRGARFCSYCQRDITAASEGFLAPLGIKNQFKDFCSHLCMEKYGKMNKKTIATPSTSSVDVTRCCVCKKDKQVQVDFVQQSQGRNLHQKFCSSTCFAVFKYVYQINPHQCILCQNYFDNDDNTEFVIFCDNLMENFCSKVCQIIYLNANRQIVSCSYCHVKKFNYDMIKKCNNGRILMMCSLTCLHMKQICVTAASSQQMRCSQCSTVSPMQCYLVMTDSTLRTFCTQHCAELFQNQCQVFNSKPCILRIPPVTNVNVSKQDTKVLPQLKNVATGCQPILHAKGVSCKPQVSSKETQTDQIEERTIMVPVPIPIYIPSPLPLYSAPFPVPVPFPLPVPVPVFIPIPRNCTAGIPANVAMDPEEISMSTDPMQEDLLMMAEMIAESWENHTDSDNGRGRKRTSPQLDDMAKRRRTDSPNSDVNMYLKFTIAVNAWQIWVAKKNAGMKKSSGHKTFLKEDILQLSSDELNDSLCLFVKEVKNNNGTECTPDSVYYLCLGIQQYLYLNGKTDNIFSDASYEKFTDCLDVIAQQFPLLFHNSSFIITRIKEEHLWESKQLGTHTPHSLLTTLIYFFTKYLRLFTLDEHMQLSFSHIVTCWTQISNSSNRSLKYYRCYTTPDSNTVEKEEIIYQQQDIDENSLRCFVNLYETYRSKCPSSMRTRSDVLYLMPEHSCTPDSPMWYSTVALDSTALRKTLHRLHMLEEVNIAIYNN